MKITILNKNAFNKLMVDNNITPNNVGDKKDLYIISINDTEGEKSISYFQDTEAHNVLKLYFDDETIDMPDIPLIGGGTTSLKVMTEDQGKEIIKFLEYVKNNLTDKTTLVLHCTAGQNRSGSVGKFAADFFNYGQTRLLTENPMIKGNSEVTRILNKLWLWSHYDD